MEYSNTAVKINIASPKFSITRNKKQKLTFKRNSKKKRNRTVRSNTIPTPKPKPKSKKKKENSRKTKRSKSEVNAIKDNEDEKKNDNISILQRTSTSQIEYSNVMAKDEENYNLKKNKKQTKEKVKEINMLLDRMENDLQFIFSCNFLNKSLQANCNKIYNLCASLHYALVEYKLSFLAPVCRIKLIELDSIFICIIKQFKRYLKHKQKMNKLIVLIANIEAHSSIILYSLVRARQLFLQFHENKKLLIFWMNLFPKNELEFVELSWLGFVNNIQGKQCSKKFKKFKKFKVENMLIVLTDNYAVLTIQEFKKSVSEHKSVAGWLNDMYAFIYYSLSS